MGIEPTLRLTLKAQPYEVMAWGEKEKEFRKPSDWIKSRLFHKDETLKTYTYIEFTNGYGATRPRFSALYWGFSVAEMDETITYSNGLIVKVNKGDFIIHFTKI